MSRDMQAIRLAYVIHFQCCPAGLTDPEESMILQRLVFSFLVGISMRWQSLLGHIICTEHLGGGHNPRMPWWPNQRNSFLGFLEHREMFTEFPLFCNQ